MILIFIREDFIGNPCRHVCSYIILNVLPNRAILISRIKYLLSKI